MLQLIESNIPKELKSINQWICWQAKHLPETNRIDKLPKNPLTGGNASVINSNTLATFEDAVKGMERFDFTGIGIVLTLDTGLVGIDVDHCYNDGKLTSEALEIGKECQSYTELSPSGTGLRIFAYGVLPEGRRKKNNVEMYNQGRFLTVTGHRIGKSTEVQARQEAIQRVHTKHLADAVKIVPPRRTFNSFICNTNSQGVIAKIEKSKHADKFKSLMSGDTTGFESHSSADLGLCAILAYWSDRNSNIIDEIFRSSGLMRDKWNRKTGSSTYGQMTVKKVV